ncbi:hypothetical protein J6590_062001 [Homalodisca vitripennis]|nr:hypothetical protein J6590_062001 [Homalodisca vitripennis]
MRVLCVPHIRGTTVRSWKESNAVSSDLLGFIWASLILSSLSVSINGFIECPDLLAKVDLKVPRSIRSSEVFGRKLFYALYGFSSSFPCLQRSGNLLCSSVHFFSPSLHSSKRQLCTLTTYSSLLCTQVTITSQLDQLE